MAGMRDRSWPVLLALTALVLPAHLALLLRSPHWHNPRAAPPVRAWSMRALPAAVPKADHPADAPRYEHRAPQPLAPMPRPRPAARIATAFAPPVGGALAAASAPPAATVHAPLALPGPARWQYEVQTQVRQQLRQAEGTLFWQHDGTRYEARLELGEGFGTGPRRLASEGRIGPEGLLPARFADTGRRAALAAHIDAAGARVVFSANTPDAALQAGAQDRLSVLLQLTALLAGAPARYTAGSTISVQTIGPREAEVWTFTVDGLDEVPLPDGPAMLLKLVREPQRAYDTRMEVWFDPRQGHLPARMRTTLASGDWQDLRLRASESTPFR